MALGIEPLDHARHAGGRDAEVRLDQDGEMKNHEMEKKVSLT